MKQSFELSSQISNHILKPTCSALIVLENNMSKKTAARDWFLGSIRAISGDAGALRALEALG